MEFTVAPTVHAYNQGGRQNKPTNPRSMLNMTLILGNNLCGWETRPLHHSGRRKIRQVENMQGRKKLKKKKL